MQVSWIDSDQLKGLLERLGDSVPQAKSGTQAWETHTMPEAGVEPVLMEEEAEVSEEVGHAWGVAEVEVKPEEVEASEAVAEAEEEVESGVVEGVKHEEVAPEVARIRDRLREVRERAEAAGLLKRPVPPLAAVVAPVVVEVAATMGTKDEDEDEDEVAVVPEAGVAEEEGYFEVPVGSVVERVEAFSQWAHRRLDPGELVLLDEHGDVLWGAHAKGALILSAMMAANALSRSSAVGACQVGQEVVRQVLSSGGQLAVLSCDTQAGLIHLAVEHPTLRVRDEEMRLLGQALVSAIAAGA
ncbi:MAG: hypothetical protein QE274_02140 [Verrucomicrobiaceae bacterium]|nr:hypothetical protein [Verrucomicrobiaceae bacterium]